MTYSPSFAQRLAKVNLTPVMAQVAAETGLAGEDLTRAEDLYRKFLTLKAQAFEKALVPPRIVDTVWHTHITHTRAYMADCQLLFGAYLHHTPELPGAEQLFESETVPTMLKHFNINLHSMGLSQPQLYASAVCS